MADISEECGAEDGSGDEAAGSGATTEATNASADAVGEEGRHGTENK